MKKIMNEIIINQRFIIDENIAYIFTKNNDNDLDV